LYIKSKEVYILETIVQKNGYVMARKEIYQIDKVLSIAKPFLEMKKSNPETHINIDGDVMKMASDRYKCFIVSGTTCVACGIQGKYFAKERFTEHKSYHFNLYALNDTGEEILMTKDHIHPKSKGGKDVIENYQTMCLPCNEKKGNDFEEGKL
jgi:5-methylcytosine-specific restriction endonuclease McrA